MDVGVVDRVVKPQGQLDFGEVLGQAGRRPQRRETFVQVLLRVIRAVRLGVARQELRPQTLGRRGAQQLARRPPSYPTTSKVPRSRRYGQTCAYASRARSLIGKWASYSARSVFMWSEAMKRR